MKKTKSIWTCPSYKEVRDCPSRGKAWQRDQHQAIKWPVVPLLPVACCCGAGLLGGLSKKDSATSWCVQRASMLRHCRLIRKRGKVLLMWKEVRWKKTALSSAGSRGAAGWAPARAGSPRATHSRHGLLASGCKGRAAPSAGSLRTAATRREVLPMPHMEAEGHSTGLHSVPWASGVGREPAQRGPSRGVPLALVAREQAAGFYLLSQQFTACLEASCLSQLYLDRLFSYVRAAARWVQLGQAKAPRFALTVKERRTIAMPLLCFLFLRLPCTFPQQTDTDLISPYVKMHFKKKHRREEYHERQGWCVCLGWGRRLGLLFACLSIRNKLLLKKKKKKKLR